MLPKRAGASSRRQAARMILKGVLPNSFVLHYRKTFCIVEYRAVFRGSRPRLAGENDRERTSLSLRPFSIKKKAALGDSPEGVFWVGHSGF
jgi:hypothetical protein